MILQNSASYELQSFDIETFVLESEFLKENPLGDSNKKYNLVLKPKKGGDSGNSPLVIVLAGFTGNAGKYFNYKSFEQNYPQSVDQWYQSNPETSPPTFLFVDAMSSLGGSQFINSLGVGLYEDYIVRELIPAFRKNYQVSNDPKDICLVGGSSGGYGALHLASKYPDIFGKLAAIAPDSDFETSLLPELYQALPLIERWGGVEEIIIELKQERLFRKKSSHTVLNVIAMAKCYSESSESLFPFDTKTGLLNESLWDVWLKNDPIYFLKDRVKNLSKLSGIFIEVGKYDQFNLQYGARKINTLLSENKIDHHYKEFKGTHFDLSTRRPEVWRWLSK